MKNINAKAIYQPKKLFLFSLFCLLSGLTTFAQTSDTIVKRDDFRNAIKFNLTANIFYDSAFLVTYERVLSDHRSFSVQAGYLEFPTIVATKLENEKLTKNLSRGGYSISGDYRFYLANENKHNAPHGVYLAPYLSYVSFSNNRKSATYTNPDDGIKSNVVLNTDLAFASFGGELGYQFVIGRRWVIDCILLGPSLTQYKFKAKLDGDLSNVVDPEGEAAKIIDALIERFPGLKDLNNGITKTGARDMWSGGYRYSINIGYRF